MMSAPVQTLDWEIEVFFDNDCPFCRREIGLLRRFDRRGRIRFTDISAPEFDPIAYGKTLDVMMEEIHARLPDGQWITGVEVFRRLYTAIGFGWFVAFTRLPGASQLLESVYRTFARNRLRLTGRCAADSKSCKVS